AVIVAVRFFGTGRAVFRYAERLAVHQGCCPGRIKSACESGMPSDRRLLNGIVLRDVAVPYRCLSPLEISCAVELLAGLCPSRLLLLLGERPPAFYVLWRRGLCGVLRSAGSRRLFWCCC